VFLNNKNNKKLGVFKVSSNEEIKPASNWLRYSPPGREKTDESFSEKKNTELVFQPKDFLIKYRTSYISWAVWRWFTVSFYKRLFVAFIEFQTDNEETTLKGWVGYTLIHFPRTLKRQIKGIQHQIIDTWTIETTLRLSLLPFTLLIGSLQSSYIRYPFLLPQGENTVQKLSWNDFKTKVKFAKITNKKFKIYDKFLITEIPNSQKTYQIILPPTTSNKEIILAIQKKLSKPLNKKVFEKKKSLTDLTQTKSTQYIKKEKIFSKNKAQYRKNYFRHLRKRADILKIKLPDLYFYNDPREFLPGIDTNLTIFFRIYTTLFPLWFVTQVWNRINSINIDARTTKAKKVNNSQNKKRFKDLAGIEKLLPDLEELVKSLKIKFTKSKLSLYTPKGYILVGPPGTGKTLLAQAIAGESGVTFFFTAGSEFIEHQNGIGAARLRDLFKKAKKESPAILFIDEIDTLGKTRAGSLTSLNEISNRSEDKIQILTEFLVQMDGFSQRKNLIIIGATNFFEALDPAFIRPGRFDRIFQLELPSQSVRIEILKLHASKNKIDKNIEWDYFGKYTAGFSGADLAAIVNESLLKVLHDKTKSHTFQSLHHGLDRICTYSKEETNLGEIDLFTKTRNSYYQAGRGIIHSLTPELKNLLSLDLKVRPKNLRYQKIEKQVKPLRSQITNKKILEARILGYLSGFIAEYYAFIQLDPSEKFNKQFWLSQQSNLDLEKATNLVAAMVDDYGMYNTSFFIAANASFEINSTNKRFNASEIDGYNQMWLSTQDYFTNIMNEEEDKEKPIRMNWRFLSFWVWDLTNQVYSSKKIPKWGKSCIDEKSQEDQESLVPDNYFHKNQLFQIDSNYTKNRETFIQNKLKTTFKKGMGILETNSELMNFLAYSLICKERLIEKEVTGILANYVELPEKELVG
jgi:ATP-dependent Zn protease